MGIKFVIKFARQSGMGGGGTQVSERRHFYSFMEKGQRHPPSPPYHVLVGQPFHSLCSLPLLINC